MVLSTAGRRATAGALSLFFLLLLAGPSSAQTPLDPVTEPAFDQSLTIAVVCERAFLFPPYAGQDETQCEVRDLSRDSLIIPGQPGGTSLSPHTLKFSYVPDANATAGWQVVLSQAVAYPVGGQTVPFTVNVKATPLVGSQDYRFNVVVDYEGPNGHNSTHIVPFAVEVQNYDFAVVSMRSSTLSQKAGQDEIVRYEVIVENVGVYPDSYRFSVKADPDLRISIPPNLYIPPGETRSAFIDVLTPHGKIYEIGRSTALNVKVTSVTGSGIYGTVGVLQIRGPYIPLYWIPLLLVGLASAAVVTRGSSDKLERRRMEKGRPRRVELTPRQQAVLAQLKRTNKETYKEKKSTLDTVYAERSADYRAHRKDRVAADREEARSARAEFQAQKKARKERRVAEKKAAILAKKEERAEAKLLKKKEKVLAKKRKVLAKAQAKQAKRDAKQAKKDAKLAAKEAKADAKQAKKEAAAAKKAEKAARKQQK